MNEIEANRDGRVVLTEPRGATLLITLNRPGMRNALNLALARGVADAFDALDADPDLQVGVVTGAGKGFCAGMDLKAFTAGEDIWAGEEDDKGIRRLVTRAARKPLIAAVEGFAVAGGLELALACDILVAGRSSKLGVPETKRSLFAAGGALRSLPRRVGPGMALKLALTGGLVDGTTAKEIGLVDELVDDGSAADAALALAATIAENGPLGLAATKRVVRDLADLSADEFYARQQPLIDSVFDSEDAREGSLAFAEKRRPVWTGR